MDTPGSMGYLEAFHEFTELVGSLLFSCLCGGR